MTALTAAADSFVRTARIFAMDQPITGFHLDEQRHWVAELSCGHFQHVRHDPPWQERPWVMTEAGRAAMLGKFLDCRKCDAGAPPDELPGR